jgi:hypothetical protein
VTIEADKKFTKKYWDNEAIETKREELLFETRVETPIEIIKEKTEIDLLDDDKYWDTDLEISDHVDTDDENYFYKKMCKHLKIVPCRYFMIHNDDKELSMSYHQFTGVEFRALAKDLRVIFRSKSFDCKFNN